MERLEELSGTLVIQNSITGKKEKLQIKNGYIKAADLAKVALDKTIRSYDPGYMNTICCTSRISYIDGDKGILEYRGYPI